MLYDGVYGTIEVGTMKELVCMQVSKRRMAADYERQMLSALASLDNVEASKKSASALLDMIMPFINKRKKTADAELKDVQATMKKFEGKAFMFGANINDVEDRSNPFALTQRRQAIKDPLARNIRPNNIRRGRR